MNEFKNDNISDIIKEEINGQIHDEDIDFANVEKKLKDRKTVVHQVNFKKIIAICASLSICVMAGAIVIIANPFKKLPADNGAVPPTAEMNVGEIEEEKDAMKDIEGGDETKAGAAESAKTYGDKADFSTNVVGGSAGTKPPEKGLLTAGEWNDNNNWSFFLNLLNEQGQNKPDNFQSFSKLWNINPVFRTVVTVQSGDNAVAGALVTIVNKADQIIWSAVTDNNGKAYLFQKMFDAGSSADYIAVNYAGTITKADIAPEVSVDIGAQYQPPKKALDLMMVFDTTGSMGDELNYIGAEFSNIISEVVKANANIPLRMSANFYRDEGDEYVVRENEFTDNITSVSNQIINENAAGGGDTPEAVHTALEKAVNNQGWQADTTKIMILVLDAPPHEGEAYNLSLQKSIKTAAEKGIRIIPVLASGGDKSTEFLLRTMAIATGGTYSFITGDSGIGDVHIVPTVGECKVEKLNEMLIRIINGYLK